MLVKTFCAEVTGLEATTVTIEVNLTRGMMFHLSGLADTAVKETLSSCLRTPLRDPGRYS